MVLILSPHLQPSPHLQWGRSWDKAQVPAWVTPGFSPRPAQHPAFELQSVLPVCSMVWCSAALSLWIRESEHAAARLRSRSPEPGAGDTGSSWPRGELGLRDTSWLLWHLRGSLPWSLQWGIGQLWWRGEYPPRQAGAKEPTGPGLTVLQEKTWSKIPCLDVSMWWVIAWIFKV